MANACLSAETPIRCLSAQQKAKEVEREKLDLISKERQRELDIIKAQKKSRQGGEEEKEIKGNFAGAALGHGAI